MTDNGSGQPQRFCTTCGTEIRLNTQFCVNCGAGLAHQESIVADTSQADSADESLTSDQPHTAPLPEQPMQDKGERDREDNGFGNDATVSPRTVYMKYDLYRQFFREARSGLVRFAGRLKQEGVEVKQTESIAYDDIVPSLLHAQVGFNKVEEYAKVLSTPLPDENVMRQALPMLSELEQKQKQLLGSLDDFSRRLRAVEGQEYFKSEFVDWYAKLRTYAGKGVSREGSPNKASIFIQWFRDLPSIPKIIIAGLIALVLLALLSPVVRIIAILTLIVSVAMLIIRVMQREPFQRWGIIAMASIFAVFLFGSLSGILYAPEGEISHRIEDEQPVNSLQDENISLFAEVGLEEAVLDWSADIPQGGYILVPTYLPFDVTDYQDYISSSLQYSMHQSQTADHGANGLQIEIQNPEAVAYEVDGEIVIDNRTYLYSERSMLACQLHLWEESGSAQAFTLYFPSEGFCMPPEDLATVLTSMVRVDGAEFE